MPKVGLRQTFDLQTRNVYTKVSCELGMSIDGKELPSMEVLGKALEEAIFIVQSRVTESYKQVPERVEPVGEVVPMTPAPTPQPVSDITPFN